MPRKKIINTKSQNLYHDPAVWMLGVAYLAGMVMVLVLGSMTSGGSGATPPQANLAAAGAATDKGSPFAGAYGASQFGYEEDISVSDEDNIVRNGGFELPITRQSSSVVVASNPQFGWDVDWTVRGDRLGSSSRQAGVEVLSGYKNWRAETGAQFVRLDIADLNARAARSRTLVTLSQDVKTQNRDYELSFWYAPEPGTESDDNRLTVRWNGQLLDQIGASGETDEEPVWKEHTYTVKGSGGIDKLEFVGEGDENGQGNLLDSVSLTAKQ